MGNPWCSAGYHHVAVAGIVLADVAVLGQERNTAPAEGYLPPARLSGTEHRRHRHIAIPDADHVVCHRYLHE